MKKYSIVDLEGDDGQIAVVSCFVDYHKEPMTKRQWDTFIKEYHGYGTWVNWETAKAN